MGNRFENFSDEEVDMLVDAINEFPDYGRLDANYKELNALLQKLQNEVLKERDRRNGVLE